MLLCIEIILTVNTISFHETILPLILPCVCVCVLVCVCVFAFRHAQSQNG